MAEDDEVVHAAGMLYRTARRIALARAVCGPVIPMEFMSPFDEADQAFANAARKELGLSKMVIDKWPANAQLSAMDDQLRAAYEAQSPLNQSSDR